MALFIHMTSQIAALVLAAGESKRLGTPKQLIQFEGQTLLNRVIDRVRKAGIDNVFVVLGANATEIQASIAGPVKIISNESWPEGMGSSLRVGIEHIREEKDIEGVLLALSDQPKVSIDHFKKLISGFIRNQWTTCSFYEGKRGVPAVFPKSQFDKLLQATGDLGARKLLRKDQVIEIECPDCGLDIDTVEDLKELS